MSIYDFFLVGGQDALLKSFVRWKKRPATPNLQAPNTFEFSTLYKYLHVPSVHFPSKKMKPVR